jgi:hypothetical protein
MLLQSPVRKFFEALVAINQQQNNNNENSLDTGPVKSVLPNLFLEIRLAGMANLTNNICTKTELKVFTIKVFFPTSSNYQYPTFFNPFPLPKGQL